MVEGDSLSYNEDSMLSLDHRGPRTGTSLTRIEGRQSESASLLIAATRSQQITETYEKILQHAGLSLKSFFVVFFSGMGILSDTLAIMCISFAKDGISKQFKLCSQQESSLAGALFAGMLIGGLSWGRAADIFGRRRVLLISLTMCGVCAALSAVAVNYWMFVVAALISGVGVGGSLPVIFTYVSEWVPTKIRGAAIAIVCTFWMCGAVLAAAIALPVLPHSFDKVHHFWESWRVYLMLCSIPSLLAAFLIGFLDESPIFLINAGRHEEAMDILISIAANSPYSKEDLDAMESLLGEDSVEQNTTKINDSRCLKSFRQIAEFLKGMLELFSPRLRKTTFLLMAIILPVNFGYFGFMMWFPEYLKKHSNVTSSHSNGTEPYLPVDSGYVYKESIYVALGALPGNLISIVITDKVGPKLVLCVSQLLTAASVFLLYWFKSASQTIIISCLFNAVSAPVFNTIDLFVPTLYPAQYRTTGFGLHSSLARVMMIFSTWLFSYFIDTSPTVPILITACLLLSSAFFSLFIPNIRTIVH